MDNQITAILRCPITHLDLQSVGEPRRQELNDRIAKKQLHHVDGSPVQTPLGSALVTADGALAYRIESGIAILLPGLAIIADAAAAPVLQQPRDARKEQVSAFYDQIGWQTNDAGVFEDGARFEDSRPVARDYVHQCHMRVRRHLAKEGAFFLDAASGPIQFPEYLTYSSGYQYRICADMSFAALKQAQRKLGDKGVCLLCDITELPLKEQVVDGFASISTIYHIPAEQQAQAVRELYRVLKEGRTGVVVYSWGSRAPLMRVMNLTPRIAWAKLRRLFGAGSRPGSSAPEARAIGNPAERSTPTLYFFCHDFRWYLREVEQVFGASLAVWRSMSVPFMKTFVHAGFLGRKLCGLIFRLEEMFPRSLGRLGQYPMFVLSKKKPGGESGAKQTIA